MTEEFDPYYRWLGIPPREQPPHLYRLLGLELFESNPDVIDAMASRHIEYLQEINDGPHLKLAQQLLNELTAARRTLLAAEKKAAYDATLANSLETQHKPPVATPPAEPSGASGQTTAPLARNKNVASSTARCGKTGDCATQKPSAGSSSQHISKGMQGNRHAVPNRRRALVVASSLVCLIILLAGGVWLGMGDEEPNETVQSSTASAAAERPVAREDFSDVPPDLVKKAPETGQTPATVERVDDAPEEMGTSGPKVALDASNEPELVDRQEPPDAIQPAMAAGVLDPVPTDGLLLWLDAADSAELRLTDDFQLSHWYDKSDAARRASVDSEGPGLELVPNVLGGKPAVRFSGADWLKIDGTMNLFNASDEYTFMVVARGVVGTLISNGTGEADPVSFALTPGTAGFRIGGQEVNATSDTPEEFHVRTLVVDADSVRWFSDGQPCGQLDAPPPPIGKANVLRIGCSYRNRQGAESIFQGDLAELIIYDRALADDERQQLEAAAQAKWLSGDISAFPFDVSDQVVVSGGDSATPESTDTESVDAPGMGDVAVPADSSSPNDSEPAGHRQEFVVLTPVELDASVGADFIDREDGALLVDGQSATEETYRITFQSNIPGMTAILLEALPDESLPGRGPGLGTGGVFSLAEFSVTVRAKGESGPGRVVTFWQASVDDAPQAKLSNDGDPATRWTVHRRAERVPIVYVANEPFGDPAGCLLELTLVQRENLGCFRLSATSAEAPWKLPTSINTSESSSSDPSTLFVNLGGDAWRDPEGNQWVASKSYVGGSFGHEGGQSVKTDETDNPMLGTARRGLTAFRAHVEPADYEVQLVFSEHWTSEPRDRLFSVFIEQRPALGPQLGIGFVQPYIHRIPRIRVTESPLDIDFLPAREGSKAILNGVSIRRLK